ncbi:APC family permease [Gryllotalpicola reticulitermitis]|uniref:APC family permease n=1 Tax=Gryllotalpicola reticulitermitis TaxID=1184153 RepID=A0ABV8Q781_9MICO
MTLTATRPEAGLKRHLSGLNILQIAINSIIGTGWLFSSLNAAASAGPAALIAWFIAAAIMVLIAFNHAELGAMFSVAGGSARFVHYSHGTTAGFGIGWMVWIYGAATVPIEVQGVLSYAEGYLPSWHMFHNDGTLTGFGYFIAAVLLAVFVVVNLFAIRMLGRIHNFITWWKIATIVLVIAAIITVHFDGSNFSSHGFAPYGVKGILAAVAIGGIVFAYTGFEQTVQLGAETSNPGRNIPFALLGSVIICTILYVGLQVAFLGGINPHQLVHGWSGIKFNGDTGPFATLATAVGLSWVAVIIYIDSVVSPGGNGIAYVTSTARVAYGLGRSKYVPALFSYVNARGVPLVGVLLTFVVGLLAMLPFPSWQSLVGFLTSATAVLWAGVPIALGALRKTFPDKRRPFRLRPAGLWAPVCFIFCDLLLFWTGWQTDWKVFVAILLGYALFILNRVFQSPGERPNLNLRSFWWMAVWLVGMAVISYFGTFGEAKHPHGLGYLPFGFWDTAVVAAFSLGVYYLAIATRLPAAQAALYAPDELETGAVDLTEIDAMAARGV